MRSSQEKIHINLQSFHWSLKLRVIERQLNESDYISSLRSDPEDEWKQNRLTYPLKKKTHRSRWTWNQKELEKDLLEKQKLKEKNM